ncbi:MAG TPA: hypothetical protein VIG46_12655 [Candidatus Baltobacteraceae bacterium]
MIEERRTVLRWRVSDREEKDADTVLNPEERLRDVFDRGTETIATTSEHA